MSRLPSFSLSLTHSDLPAYPGQSKWNQQLYDMVSEWTRLLTLWPKLAGRLDTMDTLDEEAIHKLRTVHLDSLVYPHDDGTECFVIERIKIVP
uniref:Uncharacterized protein n=1 Tax=Anguilla anguilla TaxID=7936 RepID=A0A0E9S8Y0_ANGAN